MTDEDKRVLAALPFLMSRGRKPGVPVDTSGTLEELQERMRQKREEIHRKRSEEKAGDGQE